MLEGVSALDKFSNQKGANEFLLLCRQNNNDSAKRVYLQYGLRTYYTDVRNALSHVCLRNNATIVKFLMQKGLREDKFSSYCFRLAASCGHLQVVQIAVESGWSTESFVIFAATSKGHSGFALLRYLLDRGVTDEEADHVAHSWRAKVETETAEVRQIMFEKISSNKPVFDAIQRYASYAFDLSSFEMIYDADLHFDQEWLVHLFINLANKPMNCNMRSIILLLVQNNDVQINVSGKTLLDFAIMYNNIVLVELLIFLELDPLQKDQHGLCAMDYCDADTSDKVVTRFKRYWETPSMPTLRRLVFFGNHDLFLTTADMFSGTKRRNILSEMLTYAVELRKVESIKFLLANGADPYYSGRNAKRMSNLHFACQRGDIALLNILLQPVDNCNQSTTETSR